jgi:type I restriction enzyme S subunit
LLKSIDFHRFNVGTGVPTLNRNHLSSVLVKNLGYINEKVIAKTLGDLDDKIHLNNQINQTLESIAQALFKSWFIDFDPVRAKIAAKQEGKILSLLRCVLLAVKVKLSFSKWLKMIWLNCEQLLHCFLMSW